MGLFAESDFNSLMIPVFKKDFLKEASCIRVFGKIANSEEAVIRYIALLYDQKSPIRIKISDILERKQECAELAGLKDGEDTIFNLKDKKVIGYINAYIRNQSSKIWAILAANEEVLWQYQQELLNPITEWKTDKDKLQALEIKSKLMAECDAIIKRIESYETKLFGDNLDKKDDVINFTPESIANI
jgi:hypothetical protein